MHAKLETILGKWGEIVFNNPLKVIVFVLALLALPLSQLPNIKMDTSTEGFMHDDDPVLVTYNTFREQFGRDENIVLGIHSPKIFSLEFFNKLQKMHEEIEANVPYLEDVTSLYNVRNTRGEGDKLLTDDLLYPMPKTQEDVEKIKKITMASELYRDLLINDAGTMTAMVIETDVYANESDEENIDAAFEEGFEDDSSTLEGKSEPKAFLTDLQNKEIVDKVREIVSKYEDEDFKLYMAGSPTVNNDLKLNMSSDMQKFTRITLLMVLVFLFVMFRRISAVFYPLIVVILALLTTVGMMAWTGTAFKLPTQIVPSLLLAVSVGATVHILSIFFDHFNEHADKKAAMKYTLEHSGLAIAMTSFTTAIGVGSFANSLVAPIADLGLFASFGVLVSLVLTLTLLPALLSITKLKAKPKKKSQWLNTTMKNLAAFNVKHYKAVLAASLLLVVVSLIASSKIVLSHNPLNWFQPHERTFIATNTIDDKMNGSVTMELVIDTGETNGWKDPVRLQKLDALHTELETYVDEYTFVGKVNSLANVLKETNRALHSNDQAYYTIPTEQNLVSQELLLFENSGSDDLEDVVDTQFSKTRVTIKFPWTDAVKAIGAVRSIEAQAKASFQEEKVDVTGMIPLLINTFANAVTSAATSYLIAFVAIAFIMMLILGSPRLGLLSMVPNLTPIIVGLLIMYTMDIPVDMFTLLIGSIAIGLAVDDTIHFLHNFKRYYKESGSSAIAIEKTFLTTGKALVITTIVLSLGFYAYLFGNMIAVQNFGLLTGSVIIMALISDLFLAPALMIVVTKRGWIQTDTQKERNNEIQ